MRDPGITTVPYRAHSIAGRVPCICPLRCQVQLAVYLIPGMSNSPSSIMHGLVSLACFPILRKTCSYHTVIQRRDSKRTGTSCPQGPPHKPSPRFLRTLSTIAVKLPVLRLPSCHQPALPSSPPSSPPSASPSCPSCPNLRGLTTLLLNPSRPLPAAPLVRRRCRPAASS